jgi:hypothetical protein
MLLIEPDSIRLMDSPNPLANIDRRILEERARKPLERFPMGGIDMSEFSHIFQQGNILRLHNSLADEGYIFVESEDGAQSLEVKRGLGEDYILDTLSLPGIHLIAYELRRAS